MWAQLIVERVAARIFTIRVAKGELRLSERNGPPHQLTERAGGTASRRFAFFPISRKDLRQPGPSRRDLRFGRRIEGTWRNLPRSRQVPRIGAANSPNLSLTAPLELIARSPECDLEGRVRTHHGGPPAIQPSGQGGDEKPSRPRSVDFATLPRHAKAAYRSSPFKMRSIRSLR